MIKQTQYCSVISIVLESKEDRAVPIAIQDTCRLRVLHQDGVDNSRFALMLEGYGKGHVPIHVSTGNSRREACKEGLDHYLV